MGEFATRSISAVILAAAVLFITWWDPISFAVMCLLGGVILAREWWALTKHRSWWFIPFGVVYIGGGIAGLIWLRFYSIDYLLILFAIVWVGDIGAYIIGKKFGRHKIAPHISPGKSWEGLIGGIIATSVLLYCISPAEDPYEIVIWFVIYAIVLTLVGLGGDLFESSLKRHAGVKDSGTLIPGHGGLFDRVDALIPVAILFCTVIYHME